MDFVSPAVRSHIMKSVGRKHTRPELAVRTALRRLGASYRLHVKLLPGSPDIVVRSRSLVIFVHGCFWHRHAGCSRCTTPRTRASYWKEKFEANVVRDRRNSQALASLGWSVIVIWECETRDPSGLEEKLKLALAAASGSYAPRQKTKRGRKRAIELSGVLRLQRRPRGTRQD